MWFPSSLGRKTMPVFFLVQPTPPSMLLQLGFSDVFGGEKKGSGFWMESKNVPSISMGINTIFTN